MFYDNDVLHKNYKMGESLKCEFDWWIVALEIVAMVHCWMMKEKELFVQKKALDCSYLTLIGERFTCSGVYLDHLMATPLL